MTFLDRPLAHNTDRSGPNQDVPVISHAEVPDPDNWHVATDEEYAAYEAYWNAQEDWYPEEPGDRLYAFCDQYVVHEAHTYRALNGNTYRCSGFDAEDEAAVRAEALRPPCEHGLSASLCAGPGHYPPDM